VRYVKNARQTSTLSRARNKTHDKISTHDKHGFSRCVYIHTYTRSDSCKESNRTRSIIKTVTTRYGFGRHTILAFSSPPPRSWRSSDPGGDSNTTSGGDTS
jgi:hypothetical protein